MIFLTLISCQWEREILNCFDLQRVISSVPDWQSRYSILWNDVFNGFMLLFVYSKRIFLQNTHQGEILSSMEIIFILKCKTLSHIFCSSVKCSPIEMSLDESFKYVTFSLAHCVNCAGDKFQLTFGRWSKKYLCLSPPMTTVPPRIGTRHAKPCKVAVTIASFSSLIPSKIYKKNNNVFCV